MIRRLWNWLFPPTQHMNPIEDDYVTGEIRQAQQRLASSSHLVHRRAEETVKDARATAEVYKCRVREKQESLAAAQSALDIVSRSQ